MCHILYDFRMILRPFASFMWKQWWEKLMFPAEKSNTNNAEGVCSRRLVVMFTWQWRTAATVGVELYGLKEYTVRSLSHCVIRSSKYLTLNFHQGHPELPWQLLSAAGFNSICWRTSEGDEAAAAGSVSLTFSPQPDSANCTWQTEDKNC